MDTEMLYVYKVYQERSFSKAAQKLYVSQSAVSAMVHKAESRLGCQIFDRSTIPFTVTKEGRFYLENAEKIFRIEQDIASFFADVRQLKTGRLSLASSSFYCAYFLARFVRVFRKKYPGVYVDIYEGSGEEIQRQLQEGKIDFLFGTLPFQRNALQSIPITYEYLILGVPKEYAVNEELKRYQLSVNTVRQNLFLDEDIPAVPLLRFKDCPFIMLKKEGSDLYHRGLKICRNAGFTPQTHQFLDQIMTAYFVASSGMGVTFLRSSLLNLVEETGNLIYYKLEDELARRPIFLTRQEDRYMTKAMAAFLEIVRNLPPAYLK